MISRGAVITNAASNGGAVWSERPHFCNSSPSRARAPRPRVRLSHLPPSRCGPESRHADVNAARRAFCGELLPVCRRHGLAVRRHWTDGHEAVCKNLQNLLTEVSAMRILLLTMHSSPLNDIYSEGISQHTSYMIYVALTIVLSKLFIFAQAQRCKSHIEHGVAVD